MSANPNSTDKPGRVSAAIVYLTIVFLLMPLLAIIPVSFTGTRYLSMPRGNWSLRHYEALLTNPIWLDSIKLSLGIAVASAAISTILAVMFGLGLWYVRNRFSTMLAALVFLPMVMPPVVSAIILYFFETSLIDVAPWIGFDSVGGVILAHVVVATPFALVTFMVALSQIDKRIDMAARGLGASLWQSIFWVVLPNAKFGILSAAFFAFILSWEEISVTLFITSFNVITLPRQMWNGMRDNVDPAIAAISVILISLTVIGILVRNLWDWQRARALAKA
ncbi:putative spermidine/putrescine transport system permease protein [Pseudaminobacter salicylatoxidans]|uniref:Putative spermidine/putrescine transport system permease protein n=1 Tax=Pseudaminobacter salicylatoxidans TaxID=93369 RepID=A0A316C409_PSESE|nr:ABC transporter permease [Pseudaminobacter salicylatoxidans]PWJ84492.1 putative spermidine/putrescine transport system permease protein [Pseudaminobacter salicylatoxidans]